MLTRPVGASFPFHTISNAINPINADFRPSMHVYGSTRLGSPAAALLFMVLTDSVLLLDPKAAAQGRVAPEEAIPARQVAACSGQMRAGGQIPFWAGWKVEGKRGRSSPGRGTSSNRMEAPSPAPCPAHQGRDVPPCQSWAPRQPTEHPQHANSWSHRHCLEQRCEIPRISEPFPSGCVQW